MLYQVIVRGPDGTEQTYGLGADQGLVVGRDESCDIVLPSKKVSRRHARFFTEGERLSLEDMGSQNGVFVGGARLQGTSEIRPGPPIEIGEFKIRLKKLDPRAVEAVGAIDLGGGAEGRFKGLGDRAGKELKLPKERGIVGRDPERELFIDDDSVSRKHAEVRLEAGLVHVVTDLASSNGTFVNGERLKPNLPQRLSHGDKVRFGETHWQYAAGAAQVQAGGLSKKQKLYIGLGVGMVVLFVGAKMLHKPPEEQVADGQVQADEAADDFVADGQHALENEHFEDAKKAFQKAIDADPLSTDARQGLRKAEKEIENEKFFKDANTKADVGRDADALKLYFEIDTDSRFFARAKSKVRDLAAGLMKKDSAECRESGRSHKTKSALDACARYLDFSCHNGVDADALKVLREAEKTAKVSTAWLCPPKLAPWFSSGTVASGADPVKEIAQRYKEKELQDAVLAYVKGDLEGALRTLQKVKAKNPIAADLNEQMTIVSGRYKEGDSASRAGQLKDMQAAFDEALAADAKIAPESVPSFHGKDMRTRLAKAFYDAGKGPFDKQSYVEAYDQWSKGLQYSRTDAALLDGMNGLEKVAQDQLGNGPDCDDLRRILHITRAEPPSPAHQKASDLLSKQCGG